MWRPLIFLLIGGGLVGVSKSQNPILDSFIEYNRNAFGIPRGKVSDTINFKKEYDFIVIGAGSGGCVVTNRLTENPNWSVLLVEAGREELLLTDIPLLVSYFVGTGLDWGYTTEPQERACLAMNNGRCRWPRGKAMGGTSVLNYMVHTRGFKGDYDSWAALGNSGWSHDDVFKYFLKIENINVNSLSESPFHGKGGYLNVERPSWRTPLVRCFMEMGKVMNYSVGDTGGLTPLGFSYVLTTTKDGARVSASKAYIRPIRNRVNLHVAKRAQVTKILIDPSTKKAYGVQFIQNNKQYKVRARKEIILSAGALNSPQLLMLSGVGPKDHLEQLGIPVIQNLSVGENLQDHVSMAGLAFLVNDTVSIVEDRYRHPRYIFDYWFNGRGPYTLPGGAEAHAFISTKYNNDPQHPDMELVFGPGAITGDTGGTIKYQFNINKTFTDRLYKRYEGKDGFNIVPVLLKPSSKGFLRLRSKDPFQQPLFYPNYYAYKRDLLAMVDGIKKAVEIGTGPAFAKYGARLLPTKFPGCESHKFMSDEYWSCCAAQLTTNLQHQSGTCKMGPESDPTAVVDPQLRVYGIKGLRVVDASVMPLIPASHTNAVVYMIGEKAADLIKSSWSPIKYH